MNDDTVKMTVKLHFDVPNECYMKAEHKVSVNLEQYFSSAGL